MRFLLVPWVFLVTLCSIFFGIDIIAVSGQCLDDQRSLLLQLNNSLNFDPAISTKLVKWDQSVDCCSWGGVTCDNAGRVILIDLSEESIVGWLDNSSSLFGLQYLEKLNLAYNNFQYGEMPTGFNKLTSLTYLNLSNAKFFGPIPIGVSQMTELVILDLSSPTMLKLVNLSLEMLVGNLTKLTELHLDGLNISAQGSSWCKALSSLSNLQVLSLAYCNLSGPIDSSLVKLRSLSVIRLNENNFSAAIPEFFGNFTNLTSLDLFYSGFRGTIPKNLMQVTTLQTLDLSFNGLLHGSLPEFPQNSSLQILQLSLTNLSGTLPDSMGNLKRLSRIDLSNCDFSGSIPNSISNITGLVSVDLSTNRFSGPFPSICRWKNLMVIDLSHNNLTGPIPCTHFEGLPKLEYINLWNNSLNGRIPPSLFANQVLWNIQLSSNQFSGPLDEFPIPSSSLLEHIDLSSNNLEGPIPMSVFELPNLERLQLSFNNFNGTVELSAIQKLQNLTDLDLSYNNLSVNTVGGNSAFSSFPPRLTSLNLASCNLRVFPDLRNVLPSLEFLDLSINQISGKIPNWIGSNSTNFGDGTLNHLNLSHNFLVDLQQPFPELLYINTLDLHSNLLQGKIPTVTKSALVLDYSDNNFTSPIPADIGNYLEYTVFFSLSGNKLTGNIPESICNATSLEILDLSNNSLNGPIPLCLVYNMTSTLGVLDLGNNNLHGSIPGEFSSQCSLRTLELSGNMFQGQVPRTLANCTMLEVLNLGNNKINDEFPCGLNNLSNLRVLVLRTNKFHGPIKCPDTNLSWPLLQILDLASNNLSGNLPSEYFLSWKAMMADKDGAQSKLSHLYFEDTGFSNVYYQDTILVTTKNLQLELVKILTIFTSIDLSSNMFQGEIPEEVGHLNSLYVLNLSCNALTGQIPSLMGNLKQLESLDMSENKLTGGIPGELAGLTFLSFLNLSFNQLEGMIPRGNQFQTFSETSFQGNKGLCGAPLKAMCRDDKVVGSSPPTLVNGHSDSDNEMKWELIGAEIGFAFGLGVFIGPLFFWKRWRKWYWKKVDRFVLKILCCQDRGRGYRGSKANRVTRLRR